MISGGDKKILKRFGQRVAELRQKKGLSLRGVQYNCNIDNSKVSRIEHGEENITLLTLLDLAKGLEVNPKELLDFDYE